jgi:hypothetical protein
MSRTITSLVRVNRDLYDHFRIADNLCSARTYFPATAFNRDLRRLLPVCRRVGSRPVRPRGSICRTTREAESAKCKSISSGLTGSAVRNGELSLREFHESEEQGTRAIL